MAKVICRMGIIAQPAGAVELPCISVAKQVLGTAGSWGLVVSEEAMLWQVRVLCPLDQLWRLYPVHYTIAY